MEKSILFFINRLTTKFKRRWNSQGGYREILELAFPLILSTGAWSIQQFVDRMFLTWYSTDAIAAAMPAGLLNYTFMSLFIGTASYVSTFVAQYDGAGAYKRIGPVIWQGFYFSIIAGLLLLFLYKSADALFKFAGHTPEVQKMEVIYFQILLWGSIPTLISTVCSSFLSGLQKPWPVAWVNLSSIGVNIILDYIMIFGYFGVPRMGITGAAIATVIAAFYSAIIFIFLTFRPAFQHKFQMLKGWRFDWKLMKRLMRFGVPSGMQFMLDLLGFSIFLLLVGRLGTEVLAATNIAFNINMIAFMPMIGLGIAVSILVGQNIGQETPEGATKVTWSAFQMTSLYMGFVAFLYVAVPELFILPFSTQADAASFQIIHKLVIKLLIFVAIYSLFDAMNIIFAGAIKGAGDTRFVMIMAVVLSWILMVIPTYISCIIYGKNIFWAWTFASLYISVLGLGFYFRFRSGKWKSMKVIEDDVISGI